MSDSSRLFFALWPDEGTRQSVLRLSKSIETKSGKPVPPQNLHVTLAFLGNIGAATGLLIQQRVDGIAVEPFELIFDQLNHWNASAVLCLTCRQPAHQVMALAAELAAIAADYGIATDKRPYQPHITLARDCAVFAGDDCEPIVWRAESFGLFESCREQDRICYKLIRQWPLVKPAV